MKNFLTKHNPREASTTEIDVKLVFHEPVTVEMLERACKVIGIEFADFLTRPQAVLDEVELTVETASAFLNVVLKKPLKLKKMKRDVALAIAYYAATDFFLNAYMSHIKGRMDRIVGQDSLPKNSPIFRSRSGAFMFGKEGEA